MSRLNAKENIYVNATSRNTSDSLKLIEIVCVKWSRRRNIQMDYYYNFFFFRLHANATEIANKNKKTLEKT